MSARVSNRSKWAVLAEESESSDDDGSCTEVKGGGVEVVKGVMLAEPITHDGGVMLAEPITPDGVTATMDSVLAAMASGDRSWADIMDELTGVPVASVMVSAVPQQRRLNAWDDFWALPFAGRLREVWGDCYDCSALSEADWNDMMRWLHEAGWDVGQYDRNSVEFEEADGPRRAWIPPAELEAMLEEEAALRSHRPRHRHGHHCHAAEKAPVPVTVPAPAKTKAVVVVPRFCREGTSCAKEGCRYVHGDTIPRVNKPCGFGAECGSSDPTGLKRSQCLYMHPGEEWAEGLVVHRPTA